MRPEHPSKGDPCHMCGIAAKSHYKRPEHTPSGSGKKCERCGILRILHRTRERKRTVYYRKYSRQRPKVQSRDRIIGIDGEGKGRRPHRYIFLAASTETGEKWSVSNPQGLTTIQCLKFILSLPTNALIFGFGFQYDFTKMLGDMPNGKLYSLLNEESRAVIKKGKVFYTPVRWKGFRLNYINRKFSIEREGDGRQAAVWDIFRFFQAKFTTTLKDWKVGTEQEISRMVLMKEQRAHFDKLPSWEVEKYCYDECLKLSLLGRALLTAHEDIGLRLKSFFGAGSTASALLKKIDVVSYMAEPPEDMRHAVACSFFGGRFENSFTGAIREPIDGWDINAAYPFQTMFLPCLKHGRWKRITGDIDKQIVNVPLALVHWELPFDRQLPWGPWPVRTIKGSIVFPSGGAGGWTWKNEYQQGKLLCPWARATEAWVYIQRCDHHPFEGIPKYYRDRLNLGADARGIVLKLALNSIYGKLVQSIGIQPPYQSWIWGSNITSGCRAQLLGALLRIKNQWDVYMLATDGIQCRKGTLSFPPPIDTGTSDTKKPLGGWTNKPVDNGVFYVRPGIYFPLNPTKKQSEIVRARGLGRKMLYKQWRNIVDAWENGHDHISIKGDDRFIGARSALTLSPSTGIVKRSPDYGEWVPNKIEVTFSPIPKRKCWFPDWRMQTWGYLNFESEPYDDATKSAEAKMLELAGLIDEEQPGEYVSDYDEDYVPGYI